MKSVLKSALASVCALGFLSTAVSEPAPRYAERQLAVKPIRYQLEVEIDYETEMMSGTAEITIANHTAQPAVSVPVLLYRLLKVESVSDPSHGPLQFDQQVLAFEDLPRLQVNYVEIRLAEPIAPETSRTIQIDYAGYLLGAAESGMRYIKDRIDPEFTILRSDAYAFPCLGFPSIVAGRKAGLPVFDWEARITVPESQVVANGGQFVGAAVEDGKKVFAYRSIKPSWRMDFAIGDFKQLRRDGLTVFHFPGDEAGAEAAVQSFKRAFDTLSGWFGPLHDFESFSIIEVPEGYGGQADVTCILQTADAFRDSSRAFLIFHEVVHLWWVSPTDLPAPRIEEGLAVFLQWYLTDLYESRDGELLEEKIEGIRKRLRKRLSGDASLKGIPMIDYGRTGNTDLSYSAGALLFSIVHQLMTPDEFNRAIGGFYQAHWASGGSTDELVALAQKNSRSDLAKVFKDWLYTTDFVEQLESDWSMKELAEAYR